MPGILGVFGVNSKHIKKASLVETIDLLGTCLKHVLTMGDDFMAVTSLADTPTQGTQFSEGPNYTACLSGDVIDPSPIPWGAILSSCQSHRYDYFAELRGRFAIAVYDKFNKRLYIISDRTSQYPIFYSAHDTYFAFSTAMSTFTRLPEGPVFDINWLYDLLHFNFPIGTTTFLKNVKRMPPASVLCYDLETLTASVSRYATPFKRDKNTLHGQEALERALEIISKRVPRYFDEGRRVLHALTGGLDTRAILALAPRQAQLETYTYGVPGCDDLQTASDLSRMLGLPHRKILYDNAFMNQLPSLLSRTVMFSNGLQGVNRSTLLHVYSTLTNNGLRPAIFISGISADMMFRGHAAVPSIVSSDVERIFTTGRFSINKALYAGIFGEGVADFEQHTRNMVSELEEQYGQLDLSEAHLSYLVYEVAPKYFAGEAAIADNFGVLRAPFWDTEIVELAYEIEYSTISFSAFVPGKKDAYRENVLHAYLIGSNADFTSIPIHGLPLMVYSRDNKLLFQLYHTIKRGPSGLRNRLFPRYVTPIEDWQLWYKDPLRSEIDSLLNRHSMVTSYVDANFLEKVKETNDIHWLGKMATVEILLRLIQSQWYT